MKRNRLTGLLVALVLVLMAPGMTRAQAVKYAQAGMEFLDIAVGARSAAMAGTTAGLTGDATSMFSNPAGLAQVEGVELSANVNQWIADINHNGLAGAVRMGNLGVLGVGVVFMDYGDFKYTEVAREGSGTPEEIERGYKDLGTFRVSNYAVGVAYARQITGQFYIGGSVRAAVEDLPNMIITDALNPEGVEADNRLQNWVFDFGTMYYPGFKDLRFGMSVRNFSNQNDYYDQRFELPLMFDFGVAMNLFELVPTVAGSNQNLTLAVDWLHPRAARERAHVGLEYGLSNTLFLRGGYRFNYEEEGLTAGLGVKTGMGPIGLKADYAYQTFGEFFGAVHRVSVGLSFK